MTAALAQVRARANCAPAPPYSPFAYLRPHAAPPLPLPQLLLRLHGLLQKKERRLSIRETSATCPRLPARSSPGSCEALFIGSQCLREKPSRKDSGDWPADASLESAGARLAPGSCCSAHARSVEAAARLWQSLGLAGLGRRESKGCVRTPGRS
ncbi:Hypothetical predicted protein [Podarcis lilfordi]|uniref:Uncharacterized protein n=1 Tax=Podarcis lilfordi TaxID=74358 RepID=A0AA35K7E2_9SAUR|nr:Hypothetical predicted protein [Podarcis lilfordi]